MTYETVADFYEGKSILITGGTGFIGLILIEKLLYSCPGIDKLYIIVRSPNKASLEQRSQKLFESPVFKRLQEKPQLLKKIISVHGDMTQPNLAIEENDERILINNVAVVIHLAAYVRFDLTLEETVNTNVGGTERILDLCGRMTNLKKFVYVSTAYSNPDRQVIEEVIYPPPNCLNNVKEYIKNGISDEDIKKLLCNTANLYTFSKALAETCVAKSSENIPSIIIRPSIVSPSKSEPFAGWINMWNGATALLVPIGKGMIRVLAGDPSNIIDLIPVDYVCNLIIVAAAKCDCSDGVKVFNSSTSEVNPITLDRLTKLFIAESIKHKFNEFPRPKCEFTNSELKMSLKQFFLQKIPLQLADLVLSIGGKQVKYVRTLNKVLDIGKTQEYFIKGNWIIRVTKTQALALSLSDSDKREFPINPVDIDWEEYITLYFDAVRKYLYKSKL